MAILTVYLLEPSDPKGVDRHLRYPGNLHRQGAPHLGLRQRGVDCGEGEVHVDDALLHELQLGGHPGVAAQV